jgi:phosphatidylglycerol:prolipoprotein diacylglycerol transferase
MAYPDGTVPTTEEVHPTPVYEALTMFLVAALLWRWRHRWRPGTLFAIYLILAGTERFLVEFVRRNDEVLVGLTQPQLLSIVMIAGGAAFLAYLRRGAEAPTPARGRAGARSRA